MARRASDNPSCAWPTALLDRARGCAERRSRPRTSQFHLHSVVLVGHSYGGMVIRGVADRVPERVARLVFLDAFVPEHGQSALDLLAPERSAQLREAARTAGDGWRIPTQAPERYGVLDPADFNGPARGLGRNRSQRSTSRCGSPIRRHSIKFADRTSRAPNSTPSGRSHSAHRLNLAGTIAK